ncbi:MAG TPA: VanZ family protein [Alphaproteobacteria bacterium]|jgi:VanZ family protein|nr:VanZ family protein [Alphaproteobacteria bacterium]
MPRKILQQFNLWLPVVLWMALIFHFSAGTVPSVSNVYWQDFAVKKTGHFLLFGVLAVLIYRGLIGNGVNKKKALIWAIILSTFYGATDEFHQMFTQGRESRIRDVFIDGVGAFGLGFLGYKLI